MLYTYRKKEGGVRIIAKFYSDGIPHVNVVTYFFGSRSTIYTPKVIDESKAQKLYESQSEHKNEESKEDINNNRENEHSGYSTPTTMISENDNQSDDEQNIIPWRAHLRKTNSKLNLLD